MSEVPMSIINRILEKHGIDKNSEEPLPPEVISEIRTTAQLAALRDHLVNLGR